MKLFKNPSHKELHKLVRKHWLQDSVVLHFTGFMFGIGCRLSSLVGINKISQLKQRFEKNGYTVLMHDIKWLKENRIEVPSSLLPVLKQFWPGNLTVVLTLKDDKFGNVSSDNKVAFRVPADALLRDLIRHLAEPLISTSINVSGVPPATNLCEIQRFYNEWFDIGFLPDKTDNSEPSTIIEFVDTDENGHSIHPYLKCLRESTIPFYEIKQSFLEPSILFVCMGNICRSPIAEYLFNHYSRERNLPFIAQSAGLLESGALISYYSMQLLAERGINAHEHLSRKVNQEILSSSWLVLTMEEYHKRVLVKEFPEYRHKIFTLKEYVGGTGDIDDPMGGDMHYYKSIYDEIDNAVQKMFPVIDKKDVQDKHGKCDRN